MPGFRRRYKRPHYRGCVARLGWTRAQLYFIRRELAENVREVERQRAMYGAAFRWWRGRAHALAWVESVIAYEIACAEERE